MPRERGYVIIPYVTDQVEVFCIWFLQGILYRVFLVYADSGRLYRKLLYYHPLGAFYTEEFCISIC